MPSLVDGQAVPHVKLPIVSLQRFETEAKKAIAELAELTDTHDVTVFCENEGEAGRFCELVELEQPGLCQKVQVPLGYLHRGFVWDESIAAGEPAHAPGERPAGAPRPLALLGHHELFHRYEQRRRVKKVIASRPVDSFLDLKVGRLRRSRRPRHRPVHGDADDHQGRPQRRIPHACALPRTRRCTCRRRGST